MNKGKFFFQHRPMGLSVLTLLAIYWHSSVFGGPDISNRTFIPYSDTGSPTAIAADSVWTAMGTGAIQIYLEGFQDSLSSHRVDVIGPWDGSAYISTFIDSPTSPSTGHDIFLGSGQVEEFGAALSLQGDRIAVGSPAVWSWFRFCSSRFDCNISSSLAGPGKVHLYLFDGVTFQPERIITAGAWADRFGQAVALEPTILLVGSPGSVPGSVRLFDPYTGTRIADFKSPDALGLDGYGGVVALDDDLALVGAPLADMVYVYRNDGNGNWSAAGTLISPGADSEFGAAIAADGGRIVVGAPGADSAYIFEDTGTSNWPVVAHLDGDAGNGYGTSVAITGDTVWVSGPYLPYGALTLGFVAQYDRASDGTWPRTTFILSSDPVDDNEFGSQIAANSQMLAVLATGEDGQYVLTSPSNIHDPDGDNISSLVDNCPDDYNPGYDGFAQANMDGDSEGDVCDDDIDGDTLSNVDEEILGTDPYNPDTDGDGAQDAVDNCRLDANADQADTDGDGIGDVCDGPPGC